MRLYPPWAVLAPGDPAWLEERARFALGLDEDEDVEYGGAAVESPFKIAPGSSHYHLLFSMDASEGEEMLIAEQLSRECTEPVYSILEGSESALVLSYRNGVSETLEVEPQKLAQSLGCPFPEEEEPPDQAADCPLRTAALVEGVHSQEALRVLEEEAGHPLPSGRFRFVDTSTGLLMTGGTGHLGFADITLSARLPHTTVYAVTASPSLDNFVVTVIQGGEGRGEFLHPPREGHSFPPVSEIKGERKPERILAAVGIPAEWFQP